MPCEGCPESDQKNNQVSGPCDKIRDPNLCRIWRAISEVNQARFHFQQHIEFTSCQRCREIAVEIQALLDIYSRMLANAENYKLERSRLMTRLLDTIERHYSSTKQQEEKKTELT